MSTLETITCGACGIEFAMPARRLEELRDTGEDFTCPNGHVRAFTGDTRTDLTRRLKAARLSRELWEERALRAERIMVRYMRERRTCPLCGLELRGRNRLPEHLTDRHGASPTCRPLGLPAAGRSSAAS
jgi:hypothetical protein